jgi:hypothetical protein
MNSLAAVSRERQSLQLTMRARDAAEFEATQTVRAFTPTPTPSNTPNMTLTFAAGFEAGMTATAEQWTPTPIPTDTPDIEATIEAEVRHNLTATAEQWTATPSPTVTPDPADLPDLDATMAVAFAATFEADMTATAAQWTATPIPTDTPDIEATIEAEVNEALAATIEALEEQEQIDDCFLIGPLAEPLPVFRGARATGEQLLDAVPRFVPVIAWIDRTDDQSGVRIVRWMRVYVETDSEPIIGWIEAPRGALLADWVGGPDCDLDAE